MPQPEKLTPPVRFSSSSDGTESADGEIGEDEARRRRRRSLSWMGACAAVGDAAADPWRSGRDLNMLMLVGARLFVFPTP